MLLAIVLALLVPRGAAAQAAEDAPVRAVYAGDTIRAPGIYMSEAHAIGQAKRVAACEAERDSFRAAPPAAPWWVPVLVGAVALAAGVGVGLAIPRR